MKGRQQCIASANSRDVLRLDEDAVRGFNARRMRTIVALLVSTLIFQSGLAADRSTARNWQVYFSPRGGCTEAVVDALGKARTTVLVQAYSFTSAPIARALVEAHRRGVNVQAMLDKGQRCPV